MPCRDYGPYENTDHERLKSVEALLCAICYCMEEFPTLSFNNIFDRDPLASIDWNKAGVSKEWAKEWWAMHKAADLIREERDKAEAKRKADLERIKSKLTDEEKKLLGIE